MLRTSSLSVVSFTNIIHGSFAVACGLVKCALEEYMNQIKIRRKHTLRTRVERTFIWTWIVDIWDISLCWVGFSSATACFFSHLRHYFQALAQCPKEVTNSYARRFTMCSALLDANATDHGTMQVLRKAYRLHTARAKTLSLTSSMASWAVATRTVRHRANSRARYRFFIVPRCCCCVCSVKCFLSVDWRFLIWCSRSVGFYRQLLKTTARSVAVATSNGHYSSSLFKKFCFYRWHVSE